MKLIPNLLSILRLASSIFLLLISPLSAAFFILYLLCGISDVLDGYIARKTDNVTSVGSILDSSADVFFLIVVIVKIMPLLTIPVWMWCWIGLIAFLRIISLVVAAIKYHTFAYLHTYMNKFTGLVIFAFPAFYVWLGLPVAITFVCLIATLSAIEELFIELTSRQLKRDIKFIDLHSVLK